MDLLFWEIEIDLGLLKFFLLLFFGEWLLWNLGFWFWGSGLFLKYGSAKNFLVFFLRGFTTFVLWLQIK